MTDLERMGFELQEMIDQLMHSTGEARQAGMLLIAARSVMWGFYPDARHWLRAADSWFDGIELPSHKEPSTAGV